MGRIRQAKDGHYYEYRRTYGGRFYTVQHGGPTTSDDALPIVICLVLMLAAVVLVTVVL